MTINNLKLTNDPLTNIHMMAPLLDDDARAKAYVFMMGLIAGTSANDATVDSADDKCERKT